MTYRKWNIDKIIDELRSVICTLGKFPTKKELKNLDKDYLRRIIDNYGGMTHFRYLMGYNIEHYPKNYWSEETILKHLKDYISVHNEFPPYSRLPTQLANAMNIRGGVNKFRKILGYNILSNTRGYWCEETIVTELKEIINKIKRFPSREDIFKLKNSYGLSHAITKNGGSIYYQKLLGLNINYNSLIPAYILSKGKKAENFVYDILKDYCKRNDFQTPNKNTRFSDNSIIEFTCTNKTIGIDVTTTHREAHIITKFKDRRYHLFLDKLVIVVFSNESFDYIKLNKMCPSNVTVINIADFCNHLQYKLDSILSKKMNDINECTFGKRHLLLNIIS